MISIWEILHDVYNNNDINVVLYRNKNIYTIEFLFVLLSHPQIYTCIKIMEQASIISYLLKTALINKQIKVSYT